MNEALPETMTDIMPDALTDASPLTHNFLASLVDFLAAQHGGAAQGYGSTEVKTAIAPATALTSAEKGTSAENIPVENISAENIPVENISIED